MVVIIFDSADFCQCHALLVSLIFHNPLQATVFTLQNIVPLICHIPLLKSSKAIKSYIKFIHGIPEEHKVS